MLSDDQILELRTVFQAQQALLHRITASLETSERAFAANASDHTAISDAARALDLIEKHADLLEPEDLADFNPQAIPALYAQRQASVASDLQRIEFDEWGSFVRRCRLAALRDGIDPLTPYESFLTESDLKQLRAESFQTRYGWDQWDYVFVGTAGILAALTDFFLVRIPENMGPNGLYPGQVGSPLTFWLKKYNSGDETQDGFFARFFSDFAKSLEKTCETPYDFNEVPGMYPKTHRLQSFGHDFVLGFVFGIVDILRGTITGFSYDKLTHRHEFIHDAVPGDWPRQQTLITAILCHIGHLISDVATPMGLPAPLLCLAQGLNFGRFGTKGRTVGEIARWMYLNGYDLRHFVTMGITPAVVEIVLRAYIMLRMLPDTDDQVADLPAISISQDPKYRSMLLSAHAIAAFANAGKVAVYHGNPLAINEAEWLALLGWLYPSLKYWVFDRHRLVIQHLENVNEVQWNELLTTSRKILEIVANLPTPSKSDGEPAVALGAAAISIGAQIEGIEKGEGSKGNKTVGSRVRLPRLTVDDFAYASDREALRRLERIPVFPTLLRKFIELRVVSIEHIRHASEAIRCGPTQYGTLHGLLTDVCGTLGTTVPDLYLLGDPEANAYTAGTDRPFIVLHSALVDSFTDDELRFVLGHEVGHIKCDHVIYHKMGQILVRELRSGGAEAAWWSSNPAVPIFCKMADRMIVMAFQEWLRQAELSCDRAGLLACQDRGVALAAIMKVGCGGSRFSGEMNVEAFLEQARTLKHSKGLEALARGGYFLGESWKHDHPNVAHRAERLDTWIKDGGYAAVLEHCR